MLEFQTKQNLGGANDSRAATKAGALEQNSRNDELKNAVTATGQTLTPNSTQVDTNTAQLAKAMWINGVSAGQMQDNGAANTIQLTPVTGSTGLRVPSASDGGYDLMNGARVVFMPAFANTGNTTLNIGQSGATLIGAKKLLFEDGSEINSGYLNPAATYECRYDPTADSATGAWILFGYVRLDSVQTNWSAGQAFEIQTIAYSASITPDFNTQQVAKVTLTGDPTINIPSNIPDGAQFTLFIIQDATGGRVPSFASGYYGSATGAAVPTINTSPDAVTLLVGTALGGNVYLGGGA